MRRLIVVYNPRSSHYRRVQREVLSKTRELRGWMVGKFEVADTDVDDNASRLAKVLRGGDLVISAGGDGTATITVNGIMLSSANGVRMGVLGFGNFNDMARSFGMLKFEDIISGEAQKVWPLECRVNRKHWRYGLCYFTVGMFAEACAVFDHPKTRKALQSGRKRTTFSIGVLVGWWLKHGRKRWLPRFVLGNSSNEFVECPGASDYMAINSVTVAKMMRGSNYFMQSESFLSYNGRMDRFFSLCWMMLRSILKKIPGTESDYDCMVFSKPAKVMIQAEGEYKKLGDVKIIEIAKSKKPLLVVMK